VRVTIIAERKMLLTRNTNAPGGPDAATKIGAGKLLRCKTAQDKTAWPARCA
jgi:hypothetical protein